MIIGDKFDSALELTISQIVIGIVAGTVCSIILTYLGAIFDENSAVFLIFLISMLLMFWNPRFICFSYSGAILGFLSAVLYQISQSFSGRIVSLWGYNINLSNVDFLKIDIVSLMTMIAVLHVIEGILVIIDGKTGAIPVFTNKDNKIVGGFALQRYWAMPIALLIITHDPVLVSSGTQQVGTPNWWPIIHTSVPMQILKTAVMTLFPFYGVIGYNSVTFTRTRKQKTFSSGIFLCLYGIVLFIFAQFANMNFVIKLLVIIFAPAAHEGLIVFQKHLETKGKPRYVSDEEGIMVLEVAPNSPAKEIGIKSGDTILAVNNKNIESEEDIFSSIINEPNFIWMKIKRENGNIEEVSYNRLNSGKKLGIVFVPRFIPDDSMVMKLDGTKFRDILQMVKDNSKNSHKDDDK